MSTDAIPAGSGPESGAPAASSTVPAAAPAGREPGVLTSMLTPVQPARPATFSLDPHTPTPGADAAAAGVTGASSSSFHQDDAAHGDAAATGSSRGEKSVVRAWMLAAAARWAKGGGTQNKRLELEKAKAQANQFKETRTVNIKRADAPAAPAAKNAPSSAPQGGKGLTGKGDAGGSVKDPKNINRNSPNGPGGRGSTDRNQGAGNRAPGRDQGTGGRAGGAGGAAGTGTAKQPGKADQPGRTPKPPAPGKPDAGKPNSGAPAGHKGPHGAVGPAGKPGKDTPPPSRSAAADRIAPVGINTSKTPDKSTPAAARRPGQALLDKVLPKQRQVGPDTPGRAPDAVSKTATKPGEPAPKPLPAPSSTVKDSAGKPFTTRESRETGYRDGTRAALAIAHVRAYRDGAKDGYLDTTEAAKREKTRLDAQHAARKAARDKEQPVTTTTQPQPIPVQQVTPSHVLLGPGADKDSLTRGEVRCLKDFERRLQARADAMTHVADATRNIKAHAEQQAQQATHLLEQAKGVKGGDKLIASLTKTADAATAQAGLADEIHKQALRAAENCRTVLTNAQTRYGGIYQAVVDSDTTSPAEMAFYKG
jgi:hypothetical protein